MSQLKLDGRGRGGAGQKGDERKLVRWRVRWKRFPKRQWGHHDHGVWRPDLVHILNFLSTTKATRARCSWKDPFVTTVPSTRVIVSNLRLLEHYSCIKRSRECGTPLCEAAMITGWKVTACFVWRSTNASFRQICAQGLRGRGGDKGGEREIGVGVQKLQLIAPHWLHPSVSNLTPFCNVAWLCKYNAT